MITINLIEDVGERIKKEKAKDKRTELVKIILLIALYALPSLYFVYKQNVIENNINYRLKSASQTLNVEFTLQENAKVIAYLVSNDLKKGNTSVLFNNNKNDLALFLNTLKMFQEQFQNAMLDNSAKETLLCYQNYRSFVEGGNIPEQISLFPHGRLLLFAFIAFSYYIFFFLWIRKPKKK